MKKLLFSVLTCIFAVACWAQSPKLEGAWVKLTPDMTYTSYGKVFLPDGKFYGVSFSKDMKNYSTWIMGSYKMLNDSTYLERDDFNSSITYQHDIIHVFKWESDSIFVSRYSERKSNGVLIPDTEIWKRIDFPIQDVVANWDSLYQQALVSFGRVPREGQTVAQFADELYKDSERFKKANNMERANEALLIRAELDTTNLEWQRDVLLFYVNKALPASADKYANRILWLAEQQAPSPTDTLVVEAYRLRGYLYQSAIGLDRTYAEQVQRAFKKSLELQKASGRPLSVSDGMSLKSLAYVELALKDNDASLNSINQAIDLLENTSGVLDEQKGDTYVLKAFILSKSNRYQESNDVLFNKALPLFPDTPDQPSPKRINEIYPQVFSNYISLMCAQPKDKRVVKDYEKFMADKVVMASLYGMNKYQLQGEYYVMESDNWTMEKPTCFEDARHLVLQKDGSHVVADYEEGEKPFIAMLVKTVAPSEKQRIIKLWKDYKKKK